jgi:hypothetical protein
MATQYKIRAKNSDKNTIFFVSVIGAFDPAVDIKDPANPNDAVDQDSITIIGSSPIAEEFTLKDTNGIQAVTIIPSGLTAFDAVSHDFCDPTTWYQQATKIIGETPTTSDHLTYTLAFSPVIDWHKVVDSIKVDPGMRTIVYVDGVAVDLHNPAIIAAVDYHNGTITFVDSQIASVVTMDYAYVDSTKSTRATWRITPGAGQIIAVTSAKVKMSKNIIFPTPMNFSVGINPYIIPGGLAARKTYYSLRDFIGFSSRWEIMPAIGDFTADIVHLLYDYQGSIQLNGDYGMYLEIDIPDHVARTGEMGLVTFQCVRIKG